MKNAVAYRFEHSVAYITLASPETRNALNMELLRGLRGALEQARHESACRAIVLRAEGDHFCSGLDMEYAVDRHEERQAFADYAMDCLLSVVRSDAPVIACVEAPALGGGVGMAAACDFVLATGAASFMLSEVIVGLIPALIAPFLLRRLTAARVGHMMLSSRAVKGPEAREWGLVDELVPEGGLQRSLDAALRRLLCSSPAALAGCKRYLNQLNGMSFTQQTAFASARLVESLGQPEVLEGLRTFADGGTPEWFQKHAR